MTRLYEPAAESRPFEREALAPLWHVEPDRAFFAGPLGHNAPHRHATPVLLSGLYGPVRLKLGAGDWRLTQGAIIPAGLTYEFDMAGDPLAVLYLEPDLAGHDALRPLLDEATEEDGALLGRPSCNPLLRELFEAPGSQGWTTLALADLIAYGQARARSAKAGRDVDPRIAKLVRRLASELTDQIPAEELAAEIGLSVSRMQHLFKEAVGVPIRRYRIWRRLKAAIGETAKGRTGTEAAHAAGFFDQAHFGHAFRESFGAPPRLTRLRGA